MRGEHCIAGKECSRPAKKRRERKGKSKRGEGEDVLLRSRPRPEREQDEAAAGADVRPTKEGLRLALPLLSQVMKLRGETAALDI